MSVSDQTLLHLVDRLEKLCQHLESNRPSNVSSHLLTTENIATFTDYWNRVLKHLVEFRAASLELKNPDIEKMADVVLEAICAHQDLLVGSESFKKPLNADSQAVVKKVASILGRLPDLYKGKKEINYHGEALSNGLQALYWMFSDSMCDSVCQTYVEQIDFPGNKILAMKQPAHTKWLNLFKTIMKETNELVKKNYKAGLSWSSTGEPDVSKLLVTIGNTYRKNFKNENVGDAKPESKNKLFDELSAKSGSSLKPVPKEEKKEVKKEEQKNPLLTFKTKEKVEKKGRRETILKKGKQEKFEESKSLHFFENLEGEQRELSDKLGHSTVIQISNCYDCTFKVSVKINAIRLTNCEKVNIICDSLVTTFEITNSVNVAVDVTGVINSFAIDSSTRVIIYLKKTSAHAQQLVSKSNEILIRVRHENDNDNYDEFVIPEQFVFNLNNNKMEGKVSDLYG